MSWASRINDALAAVPALVAIVGDSMGEHGALPAGAPNAPALTWQQISVPQTTEDLDGGSGLDDLRVQVDAWGRDNDEAAAIALLVRNAINPAGMPGMARFGNEIGPFFDTESKCHRVTTDYFMWQERS